MFGSIFNNSEKTTKKIYQTRYILSVEKGQGPISQKQQQQQKMMRIMYFLDFLWKKVKGIVSPQAILCTGSH